MVGFHRCLHIQGCFATCGTITETPSIVVCSRPDGLTTLILTLLLKQHVARWCISCDCLYDFTAGRCCLYRAMVQVIYQYVVYPTHCHARLGVQYYFDSIQVTINGATSAEESAGITPRERGSDSSGLREATQCTTRHSWPNALFLSRGQMVAYYHG